MEESKVEVIKVVVKVGENTFELTIEEAKKLFDTLSKLLGMPKVEEHHHHHYDEIKSPLGPWINPSPVLPVITYDAPSTGTRMPGHEVYCTCSGKLKHETEEIKVK